MANLAGIVCLNHPNEPAVARCACCSKPLCEACAAENMHDGVPYCSDLCYKNALRTGAMVDDVNRRKGAADFKRRIIQLVQLLILLALIGAGYWYYKNNKAKVDAKIKNVQQQVEKGSKDLKKGIEDNTVNRKSTYKKNVEALDASDLAK